MKLIWLLFTIFAVSMANFTTWDYNVYDFDYLFVETCATNESCVRFCCKNESLCSYREYFDLKDFPEAKNLNLDFKILNGKPKCENTVRAINWSFLEDGSVNEDYEGEKTNYKHDKYCFSKQENKMHVCAFEDFEEEHQIKHERERQTLDIIREIYPYLMLLSVPFLFATFLVYACIRELRNLHGKCLICYLLGLIALYSSFALIQLESDRIFKIKWLCKTVGYVAYFSILTCFSWLNVMCFDIYSTFRQVGGTKGSERKRFGYYCLYAFGLPIIVITIVFLVDEYAKFVPEHLKIQMGVNRCWVNSSSETELYYVYILISIVLTLNTIFFAITAYKIYRVQKETAIIKGSDSRRHSSINMEKAKFVLYLRLFTVMGMSWIIEIISWAFVDSLFLHNLDIINCLQGIIIFLLFVTKLKVGKLIIKKFSRTYTFSTSASKQSKLSRNDSSMTHSSQLSSPSSSPTRLDFMRRQNSEF